ncbi:MAG TPA: MFS transporter [Acidobacteriota bacterium]|nr:MFS transporter [Acidobacteriota bacterium]
MAGAALMMAHQVAGKAVRDSFFLSNYPASDLPKAVIAAVILSIVLVFLFARLMSRLGPSRVVPAGFILSSVLHYIEYSHVHDSPGPWSLVIYFHVVALGAILLSGFWSLMAEAFDPRTAKQVFGRITGFGTLGGILGGILAERVAKLSSAESVLLLLIVFHLFCALLLLFERRISPQSSTQVFSPVDDIVSPVRIFRRAPYLVMIALVVMAGTSSATILDYLFKSGASVTYDKGADLLRFFARFYISTQILTFLAQTWLARRTLHNVGIGRTLSSLPLSVGVGALGSLLVPGFPVYTLARSTEFVLRGSLYRSAYELLYTPVPKNEKRAAKTLIDVVCDRAGDALGSGVVQLLLWVEPPLIPTVLLGVVLALAASAIWISLHMDKAYARLVQQRLVDRAVEFDLGEIQDFTTRSVLLPSRAAMLPRPIAPSDLSIASPRATDATLDLIRELRSGDSKRVIAATKGIEKLTPVAATQLLRLLAWDEVRDAVREVLERHPQPFTGLLVDHLTNPDTPFGVRRRIPRILAHTDSQLAVHGLLAGLDDARFEVRFQSSRALDLLLLRRPNLKVPADAVFAAAERELRVARPLWNSRRSLEKRTEKDVNAFLDEILRERADQSLEHVFSLFATVLPREPIKIAFRALHTDDKTLRGLAAEYLDSVLPQTIRERLWVMVESGASKKKSSQDSGQIAMDALLNSSESLRMMVKKL